MEIRYLESVWLTAFSISITTRMNQSNIYHFVLDLKGSTERVIGRPSVIQIQDGSFDIHIRGGSIEFVVQNL